jgi:HD-GYP domain-containing protein (c-di-GMP phosphodiesterase class II)
VTGEAGETTLNKKTTLEPRHERETDCKISQLLLHILAREAVVSMFTTLVLTDQQTARCSAAAARWAIDIAEDLNLNEHEVSITYLAALLHDIGMMAIPDEAMNPPGELDPAAWAIIKTHSQNGGHTLSGIDQFDELAEVVLSHHERYDGQGYPLGLSGDMIPLSSRIICVADCYSAMVSDLPHRPKLSPKQAQEELLINKGTKFDPGVVDTFLRILGEQDDAYRRGDRADFSVESQKVRLLHRLDAEWPCHLVQRPRPDTSGKSVRASLLSD